MCFDGSDRNSLFRSYPGIPRVGGGHCTAAHHPHEREPTSKMALSLLSINSVIPFIKRADHRRDRAARVIHNKGAPRTRQPTK